MKVPFFLLLSLLCISCQKSSPISGVYQTEDGRLSAVINDSTLNLMIGKDTMIIYDLHITYKLEENKNIHRLYKVSFSASLNQRGFEKFEVPIRIEQDLHYGGTLTALFRNDDLFLFGGYTFIRLRNEKSIEVFNSWAKLLNENQQSRDIRGSY